MRKWRSEDNESSFSPAALPESAGGRTATHPHTPRIPPRLEPPTPGVGGARWRTPYHDIVDQCRRSGGFTFRDPDKPAPGESRNTEPETLLAPRVTSAPPAEGRVGETYVYRARAIDGVADGFTWYFEKSAPGMAVDRYAGTVTWTPAEGGYVEIVLCARSVYGSVARQSWTVCVRKAAAVRKATPNPRFREALRRKALHGARFTRPVWRVSTRRAVVRPRAAAPPEPRAPAAVPLRI